MAHQSAVTAKHMPELSILTILIQAASAIRNLDGDTSLQRYVENQGLTSRNVMGSEDAEGKFAILDSIGDALLQNNQVLAISPDNRMLEDHHITLLVSDTKAESELELPAETSIRVASKISSISATIVPNPDDRRKVRREGSQSDGPLGNIKQVLGGKSVWNDIKDDPLSLAVR
jgi:hypothetical protein